MSWLEEQKTKRIAEDLEFFRHSERWPAAMAGWVAVKKQPWLERELETGFGVVHVTEPTRVVAHGDITKIIAEYDSLEEMVKEWSVD
jgi:hypothetical protein